MTWINRSTYDGPRNGTFDHTVTFTAATAGNYLIAVVYGAVTSFGAGGAGTPPTGWEHIHNVVNNGGLYVFVKTSAAGGETSFTVTHNGQNYPIKAVVYEFPAGTSWLAHTGGASAPASGATTAVTGLLPNTGLWTFAITGQALGASGSASASATYPAGTTEDLDTFTAGAAGSDGCWLGVGYVEGQTATSYGPTRTMTTTSTANMEYINVAFQAPVTYVEPWLNEVAIAAPRNGGTSHTVNPASDTAIAGANFTPTAGRFLLVVIDGAVTSFGPSAGTPPTGWTMPTNGSAVSNTGLYVWYRTAAGSDTLTVNHNSSNRPVVFHFFEFPAGTTFVAAATAISLTPTGANPNLTGLTGTNTVMAAKSHSIASPGTTGTIGGTWLGGTSEVLDTFVYWDGSTAGYWCCIGYIPGYTGASYQPTCNQANTMSGESATGEGLTWAVNVAAGGGGTNYNETGRAVNITATVTGTDSGVAHHNETGLAVNITATVTGTDVWSGDAVSPIVAENALTGYAPANWMIAASTDTTSTSDLGALGFTTAMSVQAGSSIDFKIHSGGTAYNLEIIRLGWYGGDGARLITTINHPAGATQSEGTLRTQGETGVGSRDCANWTVTDTWTVPGGACHGVYLGVIKRTGQSTFGHVGPFVVHTTYSATAKILCKLSDMTWRAYNTMGTLAAPTGGKSVYGVGSGTFNEATRAWDVSYDAPLVTASGVLQTSYWNGERPIHAFLERNGYDVAYASCLDIDADPDILLDHDVIISEGHDEYWSQNIRDGWDAAINAGVHSIVASGNTMLWRVRMSGHLMVCYKDTHSANGAGTGTDPLTWTGAWRDTRWQSRRPECESLGTMFVANGTRRDEIIVPDTFKTEPLWRGTTVASLGTGTSEVLKADCLGFEWDSYEPTYANSMGYPPGLKLLSLAPVNLTTNACYENGAPYNLTINPANHHIVAFKKGSALVVNFGTNQWGWGLNDFHLRGTAGENTTMKQATVNLLADMGCQPATLQSGLSAASLTSWTFPTATALSLPTTASVSEGETSQLAATTTWTNSITTDTADYATWDSTNDAIATVDTHGLVTGVAAGTATISATYGSFSDTCVVTVTSIAAGAEWEHAWVVGATPTAATDTTAYELGTWFSLVSSVFLGGVRIWNPGNVVPQNGQNRIATLWTRATVPTTGSDTGGGTALRTVDIPDLLPAGWSEHLFDTPYEAPTGVYYCVSYYVDGGATAGTSDYGAVSHGLDSAVLTDQIQLEPGGGRFTASSTAGSLLPASGFNNGFYGVDVLWAEELVVVTNYSELEWNLKLQAPAAVDDVFQFRVYAGSTPLETYALTPQLVATTAGGVNYNETGRQITITATVTSTDQADFKELALTASVAVTVTATDVAHRRDPALLLLVLSTVTSVDQADFEESLALPVTSTVTGTGQADFEEPTQIVPVVSTVTGTAVAHRRELALLTSITATVTGTDNLSGAPIHYVETGRQIDIVSTLTATDQADFKQLALTTTVVSTVTSTDRQAHREALLSPVISTVTGLSQADFKDLDRAIDIISTVTGTDFSGGFDERNKLVSVTATVTGTDRAGFRNALALNVGSTVTGTDQADYEQMLAILIVSTISGTDLQRYASGVVLNTALAVYLGATPVSRVYAGSTQVWP